MKEREELQTFLGTSRAPDDNIQKTDFCQLGSDSWSSLGFRSCKSQREALLVVRARDRESALGLAALRAVPSERRRVSAVRGVLSYERWSVTLHTDVGDIKIEVFCERTPKTCENFLALCASNYYNGCVFHRNIKGFMVQTGDPTGTGRGGNSIWGRKFEDEYSEYLKHSVRGVVSMANNGPNTNGSQFFITYGKQPHLDMKYTVFGKVIDGLETLDELEKLPVNEKTYRPLNDVHIKDITIHANPFAQ
ncbi:peptidyl-prolyl cis-trans isomerase-like 3 [Rhynchocyon petersi]